MLPQQVHVPVLFTPEPHGLYGFVHFLTRCFALDDPVPFPRSRPVVGKSEKIECVVPTFNLFVLGRFPELE